MWSQVEFFFHFHNRFFQIEKGKVLTWFFAARRVFAPFIRFRTTFTIEAKFWTVTEVAVYWRIVFLKFGRTAIISTEVGKWMRIRTIRSCLLFTRPYFYSGEFDMRIATTLFVFETKNDFSSRIAHIDTCKWSRHLFKNPKGSKYQSKKFEIEIIIAKFWDCNRISRILG